MIREKSKLKKLTHNYLPTAEQLKDEILRRKHNKKLRRIAVSTVSSLVVVAAIAVLLSVLFLPVLKVTGTSMSPTLENGDLVVCWKQGEFERGDIIAFYYNNKILLKRVIGVSGDVIEIDNDGNVKVNGKVIDEPYVTDKSLGKCDIEFPYTVPEQRVFVLGDHRTTSVDSRSLQIGNVNEEAVIGKVWLTVWPPENIDLM